MNTRPLPACLASAVPCLKQAVASLLGLCRTMPEAWVYGMFRGLGAFTHRILGPRRKLSLRNTEIAFPEKTTAERKRIVRNHFINLAESLALNTLITSGRIGNEQLLDMVEVENWEALERIMQSAPKGVLVISAHLGNWELMPQYVALRMKKQIHAIARETNNPLLEERIVRPLRERFGVNIFYKKNAVRNIVRVIRQGELAGMLIDQRLSFRRGISVPFFGRDAGTTPGPAVLQIRFGATILPMFMVKSGTRRYRLIIGDPVSWTDNGKPVDEQVNELSCIHQKIIEDMIRQYPDQWFWVHDRWHLNKRKR